MPAALLALLPAVGYGDERGYPEEQVHAVFLYNIAHFISWPITAFSDRSSSLNFCVLGDTPVTRWLKQVARGEQINGHPLQVRQLGAIEQAPDCHILFFSEIAARLHSNELSLLADRPILLVSPSGSFPQRGGMLALEKKGNRIHPVINLENVSRANLKISSKLLRLATITDRKGL